MNEVMGLLWDIAVKSTILVLVGLVGFGLAKKASAATRHIILLACMAGLLALPVLELSLPRWQVPFVQIVKPTAAVADGIASTSGPSAADSVGRIAAVLVLLLWGAGSLYLLFRTVVGLQAIAHEKRRRPQVPAGSLRERVERLANYLPVDWRLGGPGQPPMTWGWRKPVIALPPVASEWPDDHLQSVVWHELAHIERADWITQTLARLVCTFYWFQPGVWLIAHKMEAESERAADDRVLMRGCPPEVYAEHLVAVARSVRTGKRLLVTTMARRTRIRERLSAVLASDCDRRPISRRVRLGLFAAGAVLAAGIGSAAPTIISEETQDTVLNSGTVVAFHKPDISIESRPVELADGDPVVTSGQTTCSDNSSDSSVGSDDSEDGPTNPDSEMDTETGAPKPAPCPTRPAIPDPQPVAPQVPVAPKPGTGDELVASNAMPDPSDEISVESEKEQKRFEVKGLKEDLVRLARWSGSRSVSAKTEARFEAFGRRLAQCVLASARETKVDLKIPAINLDMAEMKLAAPAGSSTVAITVPAVHVHTPAIQVRVSRPSVASENETSSDSPGLSETVAADDATASAPRTGSANRREGNDAKSVIEHASGLDDGSYSAISNSEQPQYDEFSTFEYNSDSNQIVLDESSSKLADSYDEGDDSDDAQPPVADKTTEKTQSSKPN